MTLKRKKHASAVACRDLRLRCAEPPYKTKARAGNADRESHSPKTPPRHPDYQQKKTRPTMKRHNRTAVLIVVLVRPSPPPWAHVPARSSRARGTAAAAITGRSPCCRPCARPPAERSVSRTKRATPLHLGHACPPLTECRYRESIEPHPGRGWKRGGC